MSLALTFHNLIDRYNVLEKPTKEINDYLKTAPQSP